MRKKLDSKRNVNMKRERKSLDAEIKSDNHTLERSHVENDDHAWERSQNVVGDDHVCERRHDAEI